MSRGRERRRALRWFLLGACLAACHRPGLSSVNVDEAVRLIQEGAKGSGRIVEVEMGIGGGVCQ